MIANPGLIGLADTTVHSDCKELGKGTAVPGTSSFFEELSGN